MILVQIFSFIFKAEVLFKDLLKYKMIQGVLSSIITYVIIKYIYTPTIPAFFNKDAFGLNINILPSTIYTFALIITCVLSLILFRKKRQG